MHSNLYALSTHMLGCLRTPTLSSCLFSLNKKAVPKSPSQRGELAACPHDMVTNKLTTHVTAHKHTCAHHQRQTQKHIRAPHPLHVNTFTAHMSYTLNSFAYQHVATPPLEHTIHKYTSARAHTHTHIHATHTITIVFTNQSHVAIHESTQPIAANGPWPRRIRPR